MPKFKDPKTGQIVNVNNFLVFLSCLLFGLFFFLYIGETQHALVMVGAAILIALVTIFIHWTAVLYSLIFPFIYSLIAPKIVKDKWLNKGFIEIEQEKKSAYKELSIQEKEAIAHEEKKAIMVIIYSWIPVIALPIFLFLISLV